MVLWGRPCGARRLLGSSTLAQLHSAPPPLALALASAFAFGLALALALALALDFALALALSLASSARAIVGKLAFCIWRCLRHTFTQKPLLGVVKRSWTQPMEAQ